MNEYVKPKPGTVDCGTANEELNPFIGRTIESIEKHDHNRFMYIHFTDGSMLQFDANTFCDGELLVVAVENIS